MVPFSWKMGHHRRPTRFEEDLASAAGISPSSVRFFACRMAIELAEERKLTKKETMTLWAKVH